METQTNSIRAVKNSVYSFVGYILPLGFSLVLTPVIIHRLGVEKYGFYVLLNTLMGFLLLLDFGFSYRFYKKFSEEPEAENLEEVSKLYSVTMWSYFTLGLVVFLFFLVGYTFIIRLLKIPSDLVFSQSFIFLALGISFLLRVLSVPLNQTLAGLQRFDLLNKILTSTAISTQVLSIILLTRGLGITALIIAQFIVACFTFVFFFFLVRKLAPRLKWQWYFNGKIFKDSLSTGIVFFLSHTAYSILVQFDRFVLSAFWGPSAIAFYASAETVTDKIQGTGSSLTGILFPVFSSISSKDDLSRLKIGYRRSLRILMLPTGALTVVAIIFGSRALGFWLGPTFEASSKVAINFLAPTYFLLAIFSFMYAFLGGIQELKLLMSAGAAMAAANLIALALLVPRYGINGAAISYLLGAMVLPVFLFLIEKKIFIYSAQETAKFYLIELLKLLATGFLLFLFAHFVLLQFATSLLHIIILGGISFLCYLVFYKLFGFFSSEDWDVLKRALVFIFKK